MVPRDGLAERSYTNDLAESGTLSRAAVSLGVLDDVWAVTTVQVLATLHEGQH